jgi:membrane-associated protease RseP (regulator of RpoE activity)
MIKYLYSSWSGKLDTYTLSVIAFFVLLGILIYRDRKNIEVKYILVLRRTRKGIRILDQIAKDRKFWKVVGTVGVLVAFYLMITGMWGLIEYGKRLVAKEVGVPGISFIFPSVTSQPTAGPGYILIPFWFWIIIIISVMVPHEAFHGIMSRAERIGVKSAGLLLFAIFPGAFVEPDEKQLKKAKFMTKLRVFAAGSFANFIVYILVFTLVSNVLWNYFVLGPIVLTAVNSTSPAADAGLKPGMMITEINETEVKATYSEYLVGSYIFEETSGLKPGDKIVVTANRTNFTLVVGRSPKNETLPYFGITYKPLSIGDENFVFGVLFQLLTWMWVLNFAIAVVNILPIYPLDGGLMVETVVERISRRHAKKITMLITIITLSIFFINFATPFLLK